MIDLVNELFVIVSSYHVVLFTDYVQDAVVRYNIGYSMSVCLVGCTFFNLYTIFYTVFRKAKGNLNQRKQKKRFLKKMAEIRMI